MPSKQSGERQTRSGKNEDAWPWALQEE